MAIAKKTGTITGTVGALTTFLSTVLQELGWTVDYTGTNSIVVKQGINPSKPYLAQISYLFDDNAPHATALAKEARVYGAESATGATNTSLISMFPTLGQRPTGLCIRKSATADAVNRNVIVIGDSRRFYLFVQTGDATTYYSMYFFGDVVSNILNDIHPQVIIARETENTATVTNDVGLKLQASYTAMPGHYLCRTPTGLSKSLGFGKVTDWAKSGASAYGGAGGLNYPDITGQPRFSVIDVGYGGGTSVVVARGQMPGVLVPLHNRPFANGDTFDIGSRSYEVIDVMSVGQVCVETTDTWDA